MNKCQDLLNVSDISNEEELMLKNIVSSSACDHISLFKQKKEQILQKFNKDLVEKLKTKRDLTTLEKEVIKRHSHYLDELKGIARNDSYFNLSNVKPSVYNWLYFGV